VIETRQPCQPVKGMAWLAYVFTVDIGQFARITSFFSHD